MEISVLWIVGLFFVSVDNGVQGSLGDGRILRSPSLVQPYRTAFHFQPPKNWLNGPMYHNGIYHLFYQYNPYSATWGNITWANQYHMILSIGFILNMH
ncbi:hypothetical protein SLA2020_007040 [Shorea laevis]